MALPTGSPTLSCEVAEQVRGKYSKGVRLVPLKDLGVSTFNRPISPKYVHFLWDHILEKEGFTKYRYKYCIALEPNPQDPLAVARRTNDEVQRSNGLLAPVPDKPLFGRATKNHLCLGLQAMASGSVKWDDDKHEEENGIMRAPPRQDKRHKELHDALEHGVLVDILEAGVWKEPLERLTALMEADNLDQQVCMAEHEIGLSWKVHDCIASAAPIDKGRATTSLWERTWQGLRENVQLGSFVEDDCIHAFNFARGLSASHLLTLRNFHFHYVNPAALRLELEFINWVEAFPDDCPYIKIAILCHAY